MKAYFNLYWSYILILIILSICNDAIGQSFERIDISAGFKNVSNNNAVAVADYDGDLDLDIFIVAKAKDIEGVENSKSKLFRNNNDGSFTDVTEESGLVNLFPVSEYSEFNPALDGAKYGVSWGDYDNDGFPDIFFTHMYKVQLFRNQGNGTFIEKTIDAGLDKQNNCRNTGATWFDFNNDGFLDIYIADWEYCDYNSFYLNNGDGTFDNVSSQFALSSDKRRSYMAFPFDFNTDGWMDVFLTNDAEYQNELFINNLGTSISEQAQSYGLNNEGHDMGVAIGDYNNDGFFDFYITNINANVLLKNKGDNTFEEVASNYGLADVGWAWDTVFSDFDLDGDEDLFVVNGYSIPGKQKNRYFKNLKNQGEDAFSEVTEEVNLDDLTLSVGATPFDFDNDGDLDLFITNTDQEAFFYENKLINFNENNSYNWIKISLEGTASNRDAIGTEVSVLTDEGTIKRYYSALGFLSQNLQPIHFGLNNATQIREIRIKWPSGLEESYNNFNSNITLKAVEGEGIEVLNFPPSNKIIGCTDPTSCNYNPLATSNDYSCEYLDSDQIIGKVTSGFNSVDEYSYVIGINSSATWTVEGGTILSGQGTGTIKVKWGLEATGLISVKEINNNCESKLVKVSVALSIDSSSKDLSIARIWNETLLDAIRKDYARPNVHSRNLFHTAIAMYDSWAIYDDIARPYLIGNTVNNFESELEDFTPNTSLEESRKEAMSYAVYRLLTHRFKESPGSIESFKRFDLIMSELGYETSFTSVDYKSGNAKALGNYIAEVIINYGFTDGSNELQDYEYTSYEPINPPMDLFGSNGNSEIVNPNRWQPLTFNTFVDQSGNLIEGSTPKFLGPEWGKVKSFSLSNDDESFFERAGNGYSVFHDPGAPPKLNITTSDASSILYKWNFSLVSLWSSHLDPSDGIEWDISPKTIGNIDINIFSNSFADHPNYYKEIEGGDISKGHSVNPATGSAYETQMVPRADYARVLAEFWADGPDSETPPGHWFTILNYVTDHPAFKRKFNGEGEELDLLEWDVKAYFILGGAMHDSAISAWGIKGWYDYIRPISAIRFMAELGQSSDPNLSNFHVAGIPLKPGYIEVVETGDALSGSSNENLGKIKVYAWKGHNYINNSETDVAGVDWILAKDWWPYQRPSFVTPPFAGFVSGHSTFSRAAAEVMTLLTGDEFFPGGMGEFVARKDDFLVFEKGPSVDVVLQWATYRDASDQTSLSRIWGGIHPPVDDIPGRLIGEEVGIDAYNFALPYFSSEADNIESSQYEVYPNPVISNKIQVRNSSASDSFQLFDAVGKLIPILDIQFDKTNRHTQLIISNGLASGFYILRINNTSRSLIVSNFN